MKMARTGSKNIYTVDDKIHESNWQLFGENGKCQLCGARDQKDIKWYHKECYDLTLYDGRSFSARGCQETYAVGKCFVRARAFQCRYRAQNASKYI